MRTNYVEIVKQDGHKFWVGSDSETRAIAFVKDLTGTSKLIRSRWAGPGHYRSDVYIVEIADEDTCPPGHDPDAWARGYGIQAHEDAPVGPLPEEETHGEDITMSDREADDLLRLLALYCKAYAEGPTANCSISELADDLLDSRDSYSPEAEQLRDEIVDRLA